MKKQEGEFLKKREAIRYHLIMKRVVNKNQLYQKLMGQVVNGKKDSPLTEIEIEELDNGLKNIQEIIKQFRNELHKKDS